MSDCMDCMDCIWFIKVNKRDVDMVILFIYYLFIYPQTLPLLCEHFFKPELNASVCRIVWIVGLYLVSKSRLREIRSIHGTLFIQIGSL